MTRIRLPRSNGTVHDYTLRAQSDWVPPAPGTLFNRVAYSAAHVVADPFSSGDPWLQPAVDWDATLRYRAYLWSLGLGVAEAMDTAQRGMGLDWPTSLELIDRSLKLSRSAAGALIACGAGTDHLEARPSSTVNDVAEAYELQCEAIESRGGRIILMASRALTACARSSDDYASVYARILSQVREPVIIHWLGDMFDPALAGYWGHADLDRATDVCLDIIAANAPKIDGIKVSLLDKRREIAMRRRLPRGVRMYTGDDFNFAELIGGDEHGSSDALLGIFDPIAAAASAALAALAAGDRTRFDAILAPTVPLSRHVFRAPTRFYKTGVVFLAWLNGHQDHFVMVGGQQSARNLLHFVELFELADAAGLFTDAERAVRRMRALLAWHGVDG
ncbi:MAG TPA: dihydrodipicolinate synthase family protein [Casimicrobiaceae bacterium]|nr:dihydrodipicolinate synthase family protein [Casimicrobiaceae bacterium]